MPRYISFSLTEAQFLDGSKTVTRRAGWAFLEPGDVLMACRRVMGFKKGESIKKLGLIRIISARQERLDSITKEDVCREGFPDVTPEEFIEFFCATHKGCKPDDHITRIEFEKVTE